MPEHPISPVVAAEAMPDGRLAPRIPWRRAALLPIESRAVGVCNAQGRDRIGTKSRHSGHAAGTGAPEGAPCRSEQWAGTPEWGEAAIVVAPGEDNSGQPALAPLQGRPAEEAPAAAPAIERCANAHTAHAPGTRERPAFCL
jgi:hypothetical protein